MFREESSVVAFPHDFFAAEVEAAAEETLSAFTEFLEALVERAEEKIEAFAEGREPGRTAEAPADGDDENGGE